MTLQSWFSTINLSDAYFHVPIALHHSQYLCFTFEGKVYQFELLPFGLSLAPWVFTGCMWAVLAPMQANVMHILPYLDDWLVCVLTQQQAEREITALLHQVTRFILTVNFLNMTP